MLVVSTLPHILSVIPYNNYEYINIIIISTGLSVAYHTYPIHIIVFADYFIAFVWFLYDCHISLKYKIWQPIALNGLVFLLNIIPTNNYLIYHTIWHLLSASKCFYVALSFARRRQQEQEQQLRDGRSLDDQVPFHDGLHPSIENHPQKFSEMGAKPQPSLNTS